MRNQKKQGRETGALEGLRYQLENLTSPKIMADIQHGKSGAFSPGIAKNEQFNWNLTQFKFPIRRAYSPKSSSPLNKSALPVPTS